MKAIVVEKLLKAPREISVKADAPAPQLKNPGDLLVEVHCVGANFFDMLMVQGKYQIRPDLPFTPGSEFSGVVLAAGPGAKRFKVGDRLFGSVAFGAYAEQVVVAEKDCYPIPERMSFQEAAGLFITYPTSYAALVLRANLKRGETCLVHAAAGGVGIAAVQIAKALGARVIATCGDPDKFKVIRLSGADYVVSYKDKDWTEQVRKVAPKGVDVVYDPVGLIEESTKITAWNGRLLVVGFAGGNIEKLALNRVLLKNISVVGIHWGAYLKNEPEAIGKVWDALFKLFNEGSLKPVVYERVYRGLESAGEAIEDISLRKTYGKVIVNVRAPQEKL